LRSAGIARRAMAPRFQTGNRTRPEQTPEELAVRAQHGSLPAFCELVDRFECRLFNFLLRRVGSAADAEDLTQETFLRAWQRIGLYRADHGFSTWLFTIGSRLAVSHSRRTMRRAGLLRDDQADRPAPAGAMEAGEERGRIWTLVDELLTAEQRTAVWLRYVEDMAVKDIACVMRKSQVSVRVMLFRARAALAERISDPQESKPAATPDSASGAVVRRGPTVQRGVKC
jgi:RNA polymerase sigma-70 factor, ECF subfamily